MSRKGFAAFASFPIASGYANIQDAERNRQDQETRVEEVDRIGAGTQDPSRSA